MKITKSQLRQIIREEVENLSEADVDMPYDEDHGAEYRHFVSSLTTKGDAVKWTLGTVTIPLPQDGKKEMIQKLIPPKGLSDAISALVYEWLDDNMKK